MYLFKSNGSFSPSGVYTQNCTTYRGTFFRDFSKKLAPEASLPPSDRPRPAFLAPRIRLRTARRAKPDIIDPVDRGEAPTRAAGGRYTGPHDCPARCRDGADGRERGAADETRRLIETGVAQIFREADMQFETAIGPIARRRAIGDVQRFIAAECPPIDDKARAHMFARLVGFVG